MEKVSKHAISNLITEIENKKIIGLIDSKNGLVLSTSVIELWLSNKPYHLTWSKYDTGVLCLVKDLQNESHHFRLYNLNANLLWETEIYLELIYQKISENFYCFPALDCNAGFNFAFTEEAKKVDSTLSKIIYEGHSNKSPQILTTIVSSAIINNNNYKKQITSSGSDTLISKADNKKNKKFTKDSIGVPINFVHMGHVGRSKDSFDFQSYTQDDKNQILLQIKNLLIDFNLKPSKSAVQVVDKIIQNNGGYLEFQKIYANKKSSPPPLALSLEPPLKIPPPTIPTPMIPPPTPQNPVTSITTLSSPPPVPPPQPSPNPLASFSTKPDLLEEIRKGKELKSKIPNEQSIETKSDMIDQIKNALNIMRPFIAQDEDEEINDSYQLWE